MSHLRQNITSEQLKGLSVMRIMNQAELIEKRKSDFYAKIHGMNTEINSHDHTLKEDALDINEEPVANPTLRTIYKPLDLMMIQRPDQGLGKNINQLE